MIITGDSLVELKELDKLLFAFADYIKHHERTGLGGPNHQGTTKAALSRLIKLREEPVRRAAFVKGYLAGACGIQGDIAELEYGEALLALKIYPANAFDRDIARLSHNKPTQEKG